MPARAAPVSSWLTSSIESTLRPSMVSEVGMWVISSPARASLRVPVIATIHGFWVGSQANATSADVTDEPSAASLCHPGSATGAYAWRVNGTRTVMVTGAVDAVEGYSE